MPSYSTAWLSGCASPVRAGLGGGAAHGPWDDPHRLGKSQSAGPSKGAGLRATGPRHTWAFTDAGTSDPRHAHVRLIPVTSSEASGARALLPEGGRKRSIAKATVRLRIS